MAKKEFSKVRIDRATAQVAMARAHGDTHLSVDAILLLTGWSTPTIYRRAAAGEFPRNIARGRWHGGQVLEHLAKAVAVAPA